MGCGGGRLPGGPVPEGGRRLRWGLPLARTGHSLSEGSICPGFSLPISSSGPPNVPTGRGAQARDRQNGAGRGSMPLKTDAALSRSRPRHAHSTPLGTGSSGKPLAHGLMPRLTDRYGGVGGGPGVPWVSVLGGAHCSRTGRKDKIFRRRGCKHPARSRLPQSLGTPQSHLGGGQS